MKPHTDFFTGFASSVGRSFALLVSAIVLWAVAPGAGAQDTDRDGLSDAWERGVGRYEIVPGIFTWQQARTNAQARGGNLATIVSAQEWADLKAALGASLHGKNLWLGGDR
ncbi:MAG: hypothetical protein FJ405_03420 [Verrucomicrobia bacterium]|nr:hypothetical protein [Verrucomicrobiota bacterium]